MPKDVKWGEAVIAGGFAGACSRTVIAPIERIKILYQISSGAKAQGMMELVSTVVKKEGVAKLWKGNSAAVVRVVPYLSMQFLSYEELKEVVGRNPALDNHPTARSLLAGSGAGLTAVAATYPLDVVRARMAMQNEGLAATSYKNMLDALVVIAKEEGSVALYRGMAATMMGAAPYTGLKFAFYETLKRGYSDMAGIAEKDLPASVRVVSGASAGLMALTLVYPFDVIRRRMQTHRGGARYSSVLDAFRSIARTEGIKNGLYRGLSLNYVKTVPNVAIYMSLYEVVKKRLQESTPSY